ncbi:MAG TPA: serine hydrolase domain-containing protein [Terriglobales bacterium]|nr:serine hydrolase domain-containing protein [Terriglobales bacterium]
MTSPETKRFDCGVRVFASLLIFWLIAFPLCLFVRAQTRAQNPLAPRALNKQEPVREKAAPGTHELTETDLAAFLDGLVPLQIERDDIAGAVVAVVKDGKVVFERGYGYADVGKKTPVSPQNTLFRPGSISKLFTWTAVMQLVQEGKLNLDRDVNDYLDFKIPPAYTKPITLRDLMTHTPGFEESIKGLFVPAAGQMEPLGKYLAAHLPQRVFPPANTPAYSNYGATLAGYIVQRVSGQPFDEYVQEHIFLPLGMTHSTFSQPLPPNLKPLMSQGYQLASQPPKDFEMVQAYPAGALSSSADDLARFMIAHLQDGQYEEARILQPQTAQLMHARAFVNVPDMNAMALGFYEESRNGHRIIGHGGDTNWFHSDLHLILDANTGFFVSYNSAGRDESDSRGELWHKFLDRYFPYQPPAAVTPATAAQDARTVSGTYITSRRDQTNVFSLVGLFDEANVSANSDGTITVDPLKGVNGQLKKWREVGPLEYCEVDGQDRLAFKKDSAGRLEAITDFPAIVYPRAHWYENKMVNEVIVVICAAIFLLTLLFWPVAALVRRHYGKPLLLTAGQRRLRLAVRVVCALDLAFIVGWGSIILGLNDVAALNQQLDPWIRLLQIVGWLGVIGLIITVDNLVRAWQSPRWWWTRLWDTGIALASIAFVWLLFNWHLLHWRLMY